jgi:galactokinase
MLENQLLKQFKNQFRTHGRVFSAPGRINIIGEHTDYNQGFVLPAIIKQRFYVVIAKRSGLDPFPIVRIVSSKTNEVSEFNLFSPPPKQWMNYFWGVMKEMEKRGKEFSSIDVFIFSEIPVGAGLASSAALTTAFGKALNAVFNFDFSLFELAEIGQATEHNYIGVKCGLMDQFISAFGIPETFLKIDCQTYDYEYIPFHHPEIRMVLFNSRVKHNLASSEYNLRRESCEMTVSILQQFDPEIQSLRDITLDFLSAHKDLLSPMDFRRSQFVIEENNRVINLCEDLKKNDLTSLEYLLYASHEGLRDQYQVSCPELDFLVEAAQQTPGIIGARMMGGGFGGCTLNVVEANQYDQFIKVMCEKFEKKYLKTAIFYQI